MLTSVLNILDYRQPHPRVPAEKPVNGAAATPARVQRMDSETRRTILEDRESHGVKGGLLPAGIFPLPIVVQDSVERLRQVLEIVTRSPEAHAIDLFE